MLIEKKNWWSSKMNWFGIIMFAVSLLEWLAGNDFVKEYPQAVSLIGFVSGLLVLLLRYVTIKPVEGPVKSFMKM